jgi:hypothetical protein
MVRLHALALIAAGLALGCTGVPDMAPPTPATCTNFGVSGLHVDVVDVITGMAICGAEVVATDGDYREVLSPSGLADGGEVAVGECAYFGAGERPGTYDVTASAPGFGMATQQGIVVRRDGCHVVTAQVTVPLSRR